MASKLINKSTYTEQVIQYIENEIYTGKLKPLTRLNSVRKLADQFGVSLNVILLALDVLEKKRLIHRVPKKGIYVSEMAINPNVLEVLMLVFMSNPARDGFTSDMLKVISSQSAAGHISFYLRIVTYDEQRYYSPDYQTRLLDAEIAKLSQMFHSDCALIVGPRFQRRDVEIAMKLPFPTMFLGNFNEGDFEGLNYNRIGFQNDYFVMYAEYAHEHGFKNIILVSPDINDDGPLILDAKKRLETAAKRLGLTYSNVLLHNARHPAQDTRRKAMEELVRELSADASQNCLYLFDCMIDRIYLVESLKQHGMNFSPGKREAIFFPLENRDIFEPWAHFPEVTEQDHEEFDRLLCQKLHELAAGKLNGYRWDATIRRHII